MSGWSRFIDRISEAKDANGGLTTSFWYGLTGKSAGSLANQGFGMGGWGKSNPSLLLKDIEDSWGFPSIVDVLRQYKWHTGTATDMPFSHIPRIILREYEIANSSLYQSITRLSTRVQGQLGNPYQSLYSCTKTGRTFIFPYLTEDVWESTINWEAPDAGGNSHGNSNGEIMNAVKFAVGWAKSKVNGISDTFNGLTNASPSEHENPSFEWHGATVTDVKTKFYLINTNGTPQTWIKNYRLFQYLMVACMHNQIDTTKSAPPPIYTMYIPGNRYSPACTISSIKVQQLGSVMPYKMMLDVNKTRDPEGRKDYLGKNSSFFDPEGGVIYIPDAWSVEIGFKDLVEPSRQLHLYGMNSQRRKDFQAITEVGSKNAIDKCFYTTIDDLGMAPETNEATYMAQNAVSLGAMDDINRITGANKDDSIDQAQIPEKSAEILESEY